MNHGVYVVVVGNCNEALHFAMCPVWMNIKVNDAKVLVIGLCDRLQELLGIVGDTIYC